MLKVTRGKLMAAFPAGRSVRRVRAVLASLGLAACLVIPQPADGHPAIETQIEDMTRRIADEPDIARLYLQRGELYRVHHDWQKATRDYARAHRLDPELTMVDYCLGKLYLDAAMPAEAIAPLERYLSVETGDGRALSLLGQVRESLGDHLAAAVEFDRAITALQKEGTRLQPELFLDRARALRAAGEDHYAQALEGLETGIRLLNRPLTLEIEALDTEIAMGRFEPALARVDRHLKESRGAGPWLMRRGAILETAGRDAEALGAYRLALARFEALPDHRRAAPAIARKLEEIRSAIVRLDASPTTPGSDHEIEKVTRPPGSSS